jgi:non-ribosomal peptide synthetase component F
MMLAGTQGAAVHSEVIHRLVEQQAVARGDADAIVGGACAISYRALNARANMAARHFIASGLRRGGHALVALEGADLAVALLAVLKAGASYTWVSRVSNPRVAEVAIQVERVNAPEQYLPLALPQDDVTAQTSANLPVLTRGADIACLLDPFSAAPTPIAHASIVALRSHPLATIREAHGEAVVLQMWMALMAGATLTLPTRISAAA